ncbi:hypothetical protein ACOMHN_033229 [Nucella lapillus]
MKMKKNAKKKKKNAKKKKKNAKNAKNAKKKKKKNVKKKKKDGTNFKSGTVSNFILRSRRHLGPLKELRIWHDDKGNHPHWKLDRVVVLDRTLDTQQLFVGAVSAVVMVIPALLITFSFKRRRVRGVIYPSQLPNTQIHPSRKTHPSISVGPEIRYQQFGHSSKETKLEMGHKGKEDSAPLEMMSLKAYTPGKTDGSVRSLSSTSMETVASFLESGSPRAGVKLEDSKANAEFTGGQGDVFHVHTDNILDPFCDYTNREGVRPERETGDTWDRQTDSANGQTFSKAHAGPPTMNQGLENKNHRTENSKDDEKKRDGSDLKATRTSGKKGPFLLPWWFIFVGYGIAGLCVLAGAFFTFLYSLEWGGPTSLNWLLAFFFTISTGNLVVEPVKKVQSPAQTWTWLQKHLVLSLLPVTDYRGIALPAMQRRFLPDQDNFRVGPITLTQYRVQDY